MLVGWCLIIGLPAFHSFAPQGYHIIVCLVCLSFEDLLVNIFWSSLRFFSHVTVNEDAFKCSHVQYTLSLNFLFSTKPGNELSVPSSPLCNFFCLPPPMSCHVLVLVYGIGLLRKGDSVACLLCTRRRCSRFTTKRRISYKWELWWGWEKQIKLRHNAMPKDDEAEEEEPVGLEFQAPQSSHYDCILI